MSAIAMPLVFLAAFSFLSLELFYRFKAQIHLAKGLEAHKTGRHLDAVAEIEEARRLDPAMPRIYIHLGHSLLASSQLKPEPEMSILHASEAVEVFSLASVNSPHDVEAIFGLGLATDRLEYLQKGQASSCLALAIFRRAAKESPNNVRYRLQLAQSLFWCGNYKELGDHVEELTAMYPPATRWLKQSGIWGDYIADRARAGLEKAIKKQTMTRHAHIELSNILEQSGDIDAAISHYERGLSIKVFQNNFWNHLYLGRLYLKDGRTDRASLEFLRALGMADSLEWGIERVFLAYRSENYLEGFMEFYDNAQKLFQLTLRSKILVGRGLFEMHNYTEAKKVFVSVLESEQNAQAYYYLARIAWIQNDWDRVEIFAQKAAMLDPSNWQYRLLFARGLGRLNKYESAEEQMSLAIMEMDKPPSWVFNQRALVRWHLLDFESALSDWKQAMEQEPQKAYFQLWAAKACEKLGQFEQAREYCRMALQNDPENANCKTLLQRLDG